MVEAIVRDKKRLIPCAAYCDKEYGVGGYYVGVPVILGAGGVERIIELELTDEERAGFQKSVDAVKNRWWRAHGQADRVPRAIASQTLHAPSRRQAAFVNAPQSAWCELTAIRALG